MIRSCESHPGAARRDRRGRWLAESGPGVPAHEGTHEGRAVCVCADVLQSAQLLACVSVLFLRVLSAHGCLRACVCVIRAGRRGVFMGVRRDCAFLLLGGW